MQERNTVSFQFHLEKTQVLWILNKEDTDSSDFAHLGFVAIETVGWVDRLGGKKNNQENLPQNCEESLHARCAFVSVTLKQVTACVAVDKLSVIKPVKITIRLLFSKVISHIYSWQGGMCFVLLCLLNSSSWVRVLCQVGVAGGSDVVALHCASVTSQRRQSSEPAPKALLNEVCVCASGNEKYRF